MLETVVFYFLFLVIIEGVLAFSLVNELIELGDVKEDRISEEEVLKARESVASYPMWFLLAPTYPLVVLIVGITIPSILIWEYSRRFLVGVRRIIKG